MRKIYLLLLISALFTYSGSLANTITVKGYIKQSDGSVSKNTAVNIAVYLGSATTSCSEITITTNNDGFYSKELTCSGDIRKARITVKNCDEKAMVLEKEVPTTKIVEANFTVCIPAPPACAAKFNFEAAAVSATTPALSVKFNSNVSETGTGDVIASRTWDFHDGSAPLTNRVDPLHTFPHDGTYEVCLTIKTAKGCESRLCKQVTVAPAIRIACTANFSFERIAPRKFRFSSNASTLAAGDNIIERKWEFRDGSSSNDASPAHEFAKAGIYEVCLTIKTAKGCESRVCVAVKVEDSPATESNPVSIVSLYPSPAHEILKTVLYSKYNNTVATISIVNLDGVAQLVQQSVTLSAGNNAITINVFRLPAGSYSYKVKTQYGTISKMFYKI